MRLKLLILYGLFLTPAVAQQNCGQCAEFVGNAYIRMNPIYAYYYGDVESYVAKNSQHFVQGADAIACASRLSLALFNQSILVYDPNTYRERQELDARLRLNDIQTGAHEKSPSEILNEMATRLDRMARVLPSLARGDSGPLYTPITEIERLEMFAAMMLKEYMKNPIFVQAFRQSETEVKAIAELDYQVLVGYLNTLR